MFYLSSTTKPTHFYQTILLSPSQQMLSRAGKERQGAPKLSYPYKTTIPCLTVEYKYISLEEDGLG